MPEKLFLMKTNGHGSPVSCEEFANPETAFLHVFNRKGILFKTELLKEGTDFKHNNQDVGLKITFHAENGMLAQLMLIPQTVYPSVAENTAWEELEIGQWMYEYQSVIFAALGLQNYVLFVH